MWIFLLESSEAQHYRYPEEQTKIIRMQIHNHCEQQQQKKYANILEREPIRGRHTGSVGRFICTRTHSSCEEIGRSASHYYISIFFPYCLQITNTHLNNQKEAMSIQNAMQFTKIDTHIKQKPQLNHKLFIEIMSNNG